MDERARRRIAAHLERLEAARTQAGPARELLSGIAHGFPAVRAVRRTPGGQSRPAGVALHAGQLSEAQAERLRRAAERALRAAGLDAVAVSVRHEPHG